MIANLVRAVSARSRGVVLLAAALLVAGACAPLRPPAAAVSAGEAEQVAAAPCAFPRGYREVGIASWYGKDLDGRTAASGETLDMNGRTAAHRTLPLGTVIRIVNLENFRSIQLKVNDRGPFVRSRIIEVSYGAARELGFAENGTAAVKIEPVEPLPDTDASYTIHAASFLEEESALALKERLGKRFETIVIQPAPTNAATIYHVRVGEYASEEKAERVAAKLVLEGVEPLVLRKD